MRKWKRDAPSEYGPALQTHFHILGSDRMEMGQDKPVMWTFIDI